MRRTTNRWISLTILLAIACMGILGGCAGSKQASRVPGQNMGINPYRVNTGYLLRHAIDRGTLRIGTERDYPPFSYIGIGGRLTGFDVEIAQEVARHMELKAEFIETDWKSLLPGLTEGKYDAVFNEIEDRHDRRALYDFSVAYLSTSPVLLTSSDKDAIHSFEDIRGKTIGVNPIGNYANIADKYDADIKPVKYIHDAASQLVDGKLDAVITDQFSVTNLIQQFPDMAVKTVEISSAVYEVSAAFVKGNPDLVAAVDNALATMQEDGSYLAIWNKYFGDSPLSYKGILDRKNQ
ncbi:hypothetical protein JCM10914A_34310 [Paenibacillus sp. JCM 10914]|uniref:transporter substrate-binding domain-containing protein n=1 Tax=Paenibacillus sp. JCM 10914 TaxID=1236974 RepID=UPI0003CC854A|nr:transporter substrate-binding domain-containing protein [Paenibacillus sp. JCM 10914]GAE04060.1 hypothetical protein JCM10914_84 [Paenibacillus sp. JCM 10914]